MDKKIDFIGIGAQKCGTTWIHRQLDSHPDICVASGDDKDTRFFSCFYDKGYEWYERNFSHCRLGKITGEVSTSYFYNSDIPLRVKQYNNDIKLFVCLRNPIERIISNHKHEVRAGNISGDNLDLGTALKNNPAYVLQSRYASHLKQWYECFDKKNIHVMLFDDLVSNPEKLIKDLYLFLGVDDNFKADLDKKDNVSRVPKSIGADKIIKRVGKTMKSVGLKGLVSMGRKYGLNDWLRSRNTTKDSENIFSIKDETISELNDLLRSEILELSDMTGIDLTRWMAE